MRNRQGLWFVLVLWGLAGCAAAPWTVGRPPKEPQPPFAELLADPQAHSGKEFRLGGVIVGSEVKKDGTLLEIYQTRVDQQGRPVDLDVSGGRFLAQHRGLLESEIYRKGRRVTVQGTARGQVVRKLGDLDYRYPYLEITDIRLWATEIRVPPDPWPFTGAGPGGGGATTATPGTPGTVPTGGPETSRT